MIEQSAPLGEDGKDHLADELLHSTLRTARSSPIYLLHPSRLDRASPTFLTDKDRKGHRGLHDTGERTKLVECKRTVSSKLDSGTEHRHFNRLQVAQNPPGS